MKILYFPYILLIFLLIYWYENKKCIVSGDLIKVKEAVKNLNEGGCGVFAYNLYGRLDTNRYCLKIIEKGRHIMIYDKKKHYFLDSGGVRDSLWIGIYIGKTIEYITPDSLLNMINDPKKWNQTYDRKQDSIIQEYVNRL